MIKSLIQRSIFILFCLSGYSCISQTKTINDSSTGKPVVMESKSNSPVNATKEQDKVVPSPVITAEPTKDSAINILALGDSYTIGQSVLVADRWPLQLAEMLKKEKIKIGETKIIAQTGWTTQDLLQAIDSENLKGKYDLVYLLIGVNNQYQGLSIDNYSSEFKTLLNKSIDFADKKLSHVIVVSIPDWGVTPFAASQDRNKIAVEIEGFNQINKEEAKNSNVNYIDIYPVSKKALNDSSFVADDGLHPSGKMYAEWVKLIFPKTLEVLSPTHP